VFEIIRSSYNVNAELKYLTWRVCLETERATGKMGRNLMVVSRGYLQQFSRYPSLIAVGPRPCSRRVSDDQFCNDLRFIVKLMDASAGALNNGFLVVTDMETDLTGV